MVVCFISNGCVLFHQDNPPPGSYEVVHSYDSTQGRLLFITLNRIIFNVW